MTLFVQLENLVQTVLRWTKQHGSIFREHVGTHPAVLVISDPEEVARLSGREENVPKWHTGYRNMRQVCLYSSLCILLFMQSTHAAAVSVVLCSVLPTLTYWQHQTRRTGNMFERQLILLSAQTLSERYASAHGCLCLAVLHIIANHPLLQQWCNCRAFLLYTARL